MRRDDFLNTTVPAVFNPLPAYPREAPLPEAEVRQVMAELGLEYIQARNHVRCRVMLRAMAPHRKM